MRLFAMFPPDIPALIGCVLHRGALAGQLAAVLGRRSSLPVIEPQSGDKASHGVIYLAPADHHLLFVKDRIEIQLWMRPPGDQGLLELESVGRFRSSV